MTQANPDILFVNQPAPPRKLTFQFSIRGILIATAVIALVLGAIAVPPLFAIISAFCFLLISAVFATSIFCARGWFRAFAIGAAVPHFLSYSTLLGGFRAPEDLLIAMVFSILASLIVGSASAFTHGFLTRRRGQLAVPNLPGLRNWLTNDSSV